MCVVVKGKKANAACIQVQPIGGEMDQERLAHNDVIGLAGALWKLLRREYADDLCGFENGQMREAARLEFFDGPKQLSGKQTNSACPIELAHNSQMTIASFIENNFMPEQVALKRSSGRAHYKAMLKHVIRPEEVDQKFRGKRRGSEKETQSCPRLALPEQCAAL
jgi:hypothetical protein